MISLTINLLSFEKLESLLPQESTTDFLKLEMECSYSMEVKTLQEEDHLPIFGIYESI